MKKIKTALISVSDKKNLRPLLDILKQNKIKIISSGGTYKEIKKLKFRCLEVSDFTNSPGCTNFSASLPLISNFNSAFFDGSNLPV